MQESLRLIYDTMFSYPFQNGFKSGDSCINQLLPNTHKIYSSFDNFYEVRAVFLDINKLFDKVWYEGIIN